MRFLRAVASQVSWDEAGLGDHDAPVTGCVAERDFIWNTDVWGSVTCSSGTLSGALAPPQTAQDELVCCCML